MEASLPTSAALKIPVRERAALTPPVAVRYASVWLPLGFILTGLAALTVSVVWLSLQPSLLSTYHYNQYVIAATHLFVLGWISSVVMGAMYQLIPVALETTLYSRRMAVVQFVCHVVGFAGMVWMFRAWNLKQVGHFGSVLALGVGLLVYNIMRTVWRAPKRTISAWAILSALGWLSLAVIAGLAVAAGKCVSTGLDGELAAVAGGGWSHGVQAVGTFIHRFDAISTMHAHAHLGVIGFFVLLIVGVSYKLIPMFTLSEVRNPRRAAGSVLLLNLGLAGSFVAVLLHSAWRPAFAVVVIGALLLYGFELRAILRARKRHVLDLGIKMFLTGVIILAPLSTLALVLSWPTLPVNGFTGRLENLYGFLALAGMISFAIIGMLYKIVPFLVWFGAYSQQVGSFKVPALSDLYSEWLQKAGFGAGLAGLVVASVGILFARGEVVSCGGLFLTMGVLALALNVGFMLRHLVRPQLQPVTASNARRR
jgi:hypothetical protein